MEISARSWFAAGMALTTASTLAFAPLVLPGGERALPIVSSPNVRLTAAIDPADVQALIANLQATLNDVTRTVEAVSLAPGNSLVDVLTRANAVNAELWNGLINATDSVQLRGLLSALSANSVGNFNELITTVGALNSDIAMLPAQIAETIGYAITGSLTAALGAITNLINQPLAASSYTGLASSALQQVIVVGQGVLQTVDWTGQAVLNTANAVVDGLWEQIPGALYGLNDVLYRAAEESDSAVVDAVIAAVQGLVVAPAAAVSNAALGLASSVVNVGVDGFETVMKSGAWVLAYPFYATQDALKTIGAKPLDPASYTTALAQLIGGGFNIGNELVTAGADLLTLPVRFASDLNTNIADTIVSLSNAVGEMASAVLHAAGLPADVAALPTTLSTEVTAAVRAAQKFVDTNLLSSVDGLIDKVEHGLLGASSTIQDAVNKALGATNLPDSNTRTDWGYKPFSWAAEQKAVEQKAAAEEVVAEEVAAEEVVVDKQAVDSELNALPVAAISADPGTEQELAPTPGDVVAAPAAAGSSDTNNDPAGSEAATNDTATESPAPTGRHRIGANDRGVSVDSLLKQAREAKKAEREAKQAEREAKQAEREAKRVQVRDRLSAGQPGADAERGAVKSDPGTGTSKSSDGAQGKSDGDKAA
ncbi:hypothetical protein [Mycolicibacterium sp. YH-1]|uniref:hypothetical protein n=1 Tax=Mycolicibacterium sp. YH-1 TaxID=2908837 RepID=UPI001F4BCF7E|nr:hypothetical protein [Mycolicibacterium sp. YH-1]UNB51901.1 hypothetical protein L0M16_29120 [Mycolicibacterium sp. YH-1]